MKNSEALCLLGEDPVDVVALPAAQDGDRMSAPAARCRANRSLEAGCAMLRNR